MRHVGANRYGQRGFTVVEVAMATALLSMMAVASVSSLTAGSSACGEAIARQESVRQAGMLLDRITLELKDAAASSVVLTSARPDTITFRRVTGFDAAAAAPTLSAPITFRCAPIVGASGRFVVERAETGAPTGKLGGYVADADANDPTMPGLHFERRSEGGATVIDVTVTLCAGGAHAGGSLRLATSVRLEAN